MLGGPRQNVAPCTVCGSTSLRRSVRTLKIEVFRCTSCGHHTAHHGEAAQAGDYHDQYDQTGFLDSLEKTRLRQGELIVSFIREKLSDADEVVDFGAGRGWFLEACRRADMRHLAGVDTSEMAVALIQQKGFDGISIASPAGSSWPLSFGGLNFKPRVLSLLDVVEHFNPGDAVAFFRRILEEAGPQLELVVVKVPVHSGILYRTARALARLGVTGPLDQLYQAGTHPPHYNYFSRRSLSLFLERCGLEPIAGKGERDFEANSFGDRLWALKNVPRPLLKLVGAGLALSCSRTGWYDSVIVLARPKRK